MAMNNESASLQSGKYLGFSALQLRNSTIELTIVPEIGGRIMAYGFKGKNLLYTNHALFGLKPSLEVQANSSIDELRKSNGFQMYGGEKTWLAPEEDWGGPPYMDLDYGNYNFTWTSHEHGIKVVLTSPLCRETGLQLMKIIDFPHQGTEISIQQRVENHGHRSLCKGLWQVTMLNKPGKVIFETGGSTLAKGFKNFNFTSEILPIQNINSQVVVSCEEAKLFKVGTDANSGYVDTFIGRGGEAVRFRKTFQLTIGPYGHGCAVEVYNSQNFSYFEVEVHSPLLEIEPKGSLEYPIRWSLMNV